MECHPSPVHPATHRLEDQDLSLQPHQLEAQPDLVCLRRRRRRLQLRHSRRQLLQRRPHLQVVRLGRWCPGRERGTVAAMQCGNWWGAGGKTSKQTLLGFGAAWSHAPCGAELLLLALASHVLHREWRLLHDSIMVSCRAVSMRHLHHLHRPHAYACMLQYAYMQVMHTTFGHVCRRRLGCCHRAPPDGRTAP